MHVIRTAFHSGASLDGMLADGWKFHSASSRGGQWTVQFMRTGRRGGELLEGDFYGAPAELHRWTARRVLWAAFDRAEPIECARIPDCRRIGVALSSPAALHAMDELLKLNGWKSRRISNGGTGLFPEFFPQEALDRDNLCGDGSCADPDVGVLRLGDGSVSVALDSADGGGSIQQCIMPHLTKGIVSWRDGAESAGGWSRHGVHRLLGAGAVVLDMDLDG